MSNLIEVITLMSSDEETIPEVDTIETKNGKITVKIEETESLKKIDKQITSHGNNNSSTNIFKGCLNANSNLSSNLKEVPSASKSNVLSQQYGYATYRTARKSFKSNSQNCLKTKPSKELNLKNQAICTNEKFQNKQDNHFSVHKPPIDSHKINSKILPQSSPAEVNDTMETDIDCENVISQINRLEKKGLINVNTNTNSNILNQKKGLKSNYLNGANVQDKSSLLGNIRSPKLSNKNASLDHNDIKLKTANVKTSTRSEIEKRKEKEKSIHDCMPKDCTKKRKLNKVIEKINEFSRVNQISTTHVTANKSLTSNPELPNKVAFVKKASLPKLNSCEKPLIQSSFNNSVVLCSPNSTEIDKCEAKNSASVPLCDTKLKTLNASRISKINSKNFVSKISNLVIPVSSDGIAHLDTGKIQNEFSQVKPLVLNNNSDNFVSKISNLAIPVSSDGIACLDTGKIHNEFSQVKPLVLNNNSDSNFTTSHHFEKLNEENENLEVSNVYFSLSNNKTSDSNLKDELEQIDSKVKQCSNDLHAKLIDLKEVKSTMVSNISEVQGRKEDPQLCSNQSAQLVPSDSSTEKIVIEQGRPVKEVTSPKLSLKRKRAENPNGVLNGFSIEKHLKYMSNDIKSFSDTERSSPEIQNNENEESLKSNTANIQTVESCSYETKKPQTVSSLPIVTHNNMPGPSNRTNFAESNKQKFNLLIEFCMSQAQDKFNTQEYMTLKERWYEKPNKLVESYLNSLEFSNQIDTVYEKVKKNPECVCGLLFDFSIELKAYKKRKSRHSRPESEKKPEENERNCESIRTNALNFHEEHFSDKNSLNEAEALSMNAITINKISINSNFMNSDKIKALNDMAKKKLDKKIADLEKYLKELDKKIQKLQEQELSLDDMEDEDSAYVQEERYKNRFMKAWNLLCRLKQQSTDLGREMERKLRCRASRFPEINKRIERFINKQKVTEKFPNYQKIYNIVKSVNEKVQLGLQESDYTTEAKMLFKDVCETLKRRRIQDLKYNIDSYSQIGEDPAENDESLRMKLEINAKEAKKKRDQIIDEYALKQQKLEEEKTVENKDAEDENTAYNEGLENENKSSEEDSEREESDVSLGPEYRGDDSNLPDTEPSSPVSEPISRKENSKTNVEVIEIETDSDASTDPGYRNVSCKEQFSSDVSKLSTTAYHSKPHLESDSSSDLPSL